MKNLIRKILKEETDDLEWVNGLDINLAEKETKKYFISATRDFGVDGESLYNMFVEYGVHNPSDLIEIGSQLYDQFQITNDNGYDYGRDDCHCDGCCDDYVWYETYHEDVEKAKGEGYGEGYDEATNVLQKKIDELEGELEDLRSRLGE